VPSDAETARCLSVCLPAAPCKQAACWSCHDRHGWCVKVSRLLQGALASALLDQAAAQARGGRCEAALPLVEEAQSLTPAALHAALVCDNQH